MHFFRLGSPAQEGKQAGICPVESPNPQEFMIAIRLGFRSFH
jgi:hypothetical protein